MRKLFISMTLLLSSIVCLNAQDYNIGLRAGINYAQFLGETEANESIDFSSGFHFGLNFQWNFTDIFGVRGEFLYIQNGSQSHYDSTGTFYYIFEPSGLPTVYDKGTGKFDLDISNATLSFPITAHVQVSRKWELFGGIYTSLIVGPRGSGELDYRSFDTEVGNFFQAHDYDYNDDVAGEANFILEPVVVNLNGDQISLPRAVGAYYFLKSKDGSKIKKFDAGLVAGGSYYLNPGFYIGLRAEYGFMDLTNDNLDFSLNSLDAENNFITRSDNDTHFGIQVSLGFKF